MANQFKGNISMQDRANWIAGAGNQAAARIVAHAQKVEKALDQKMEEIDNMGEDDFAALRQKRLAAMKKRQEMMQIWKQKGHGKYQELADQKQWFEESKSNDRMICHFYRPTTWRCEVVDKHLERIAPKHLETRIVKINAEKCPFLCERLNIVLLPTIIMTKENHAVDRIEGFDELGGTDDFPTAILEKRLAFQQIIDYEGDLSGGIQGRQFSMAKAGKESARSSRQITKGRQDFYDGDGEDYWSD